MALLSHCIDKSLPITKAISAQPVFVHLLETWEALSAAEAEKAAEDAKLFKNKIKDTTIQTEEVRHLPVDILQDVECRKGGLD